VSLEAAAGAALSPRILVIEDEPSIANAVAARLRSEGYTVEVAGDGPTGLDSFTRFGPDLVVLDLMLPGIDGLEVCRRMQLERSVPILMLTARDGEQDLITGLETGADDYMTKPFSARELVARVHAILRRMSRARQKTEQAPTRIGDVELDPSTRRVRVNGEAVHLTPTEFDLVMYLAANRGRVATREELLEQVWGYEVPSGARTVDSHVRSVRRKLGADLIRTVHGVGYAVDDEVES
jgi:DNA-binding response OmpR family regulator